MDAIHLKIDSNFVVVLSRFLIVIKPIAGSKKILSSLHTGFIDSNNVNICSYSISIILSDVYFYCGGGVWEP